MGDPSNLPGIGQYLLTTFLALLLVVSLAVLVLYLLRRVAPASGRTVKLVESVPLEPRRSLHLVQIGDRILLIGSTDGSLTLIADFAKSAIELPEPRPRRRFLDLVRRGP